MTGLVPDCYLPRRDLRYRTSAAAPPPSARSVSVAGSGDPTIGRGNTAVVGVCAATDAVSSSDARIVAGPSHRVMLLFHSLMVESSSASGCLRIRRLLLGVAQGSNLPARSAAAVYGHFQHQSRHQASLMQAFCPAGASTVAFHLAWADADRRGTSATDSLQSRTDRIGAPVPLRK